jgi:hypothetical protein
VKVADRSIKQDASIWAKTTLRTLERLENFDSDWEKMEAGGWM